MSEVLIKSITEKLGSEGVSYVKEHGELPIMKLTDDEMKFLKGGLRDLIKRLLSCKGKDEKDPLPPPDLGDGLF